MINQSVSVQFSCQQKITNLLQHGHQFFTLLPESQNIPQISKWPPVFLARVDIIRELFLIFSEYYSKMTHKDAKMQRLSMKTTESNFSIH